LETDLYLDASASASVQQLDTSLQLQSDASSNESKRDDTQSVGNATATAAATSTVRTNFWKELMNFLDRRVNIFATSSASTTAPNVTEGTLANVRVEEVDAKRATIVWSPSVFQNLRVYYSTTTPVVATDTTKHVSPWKFWKRSEVTLKGLIPDTTYFYKVVAETNSGTITTTEASFRTTAK
jgi:hypothetical protein